jgi:hypothetical protein
VVKILYLLHLRNEALIVGFCGTHFHLKVGYILLLAPHRRQWARANSKSNDQVAKSKDKKPRSYFAHCYLLLQVTIYHKYRVIGRTQSAP